MGDPDGEAEGGCFGGGLQAELEGWLSGPVWGLPVWGGGLLGLWALTVALLLHWLFLFIVVAMWGVSCPVREGCWLFFILVHCCCHVGCLLHIAGGDRGKKTNKKQTNKKQTKKQEKPVSLLERPMLIKTKEKNKEKIG
jgi:hypothetical protein